MNGTLLKYPGSKNMIAQKIISYFPEGYRKMTYLEPFFGSGSVFFQKSPSEVETINDLNDEVYNFFRQVRENGEELSRLIENTPWSRREFEESSVKTESDIENARRFLVRCWFSIGASSAIRHKGGWSNNIKRANGNICSFSKLPEVIKEASLRLRPKPGNCVQIENRDAFELIEKYNRKNVLMYLDPPYVLSTRKIKKRYFHEMTDDDHIRLCDLINKSSAKIILSGYPNELYEEYLHGFKKIGIPAYDEKGTRRIEVLWANYSINNELFNLQEQTEVLYA